MESSKNLRETSHYIAHRIGADTDIKNGLIDRVYEALKNLEKQEDYVACLAIYEALEHHRNQKTQLPVSKQILLQKHTN